MRMVYGTQRKREEKNHRHSQARDGEGEQLHNAGDSPTWVNLKNILLRPKSVHCAVPHREVHKHVKLNLVVQGYTHEL